MVFKLGKSEFVSCSCAQCKIKKTVSSHLRVTRHHYCCRPSFRGQLQNPISSVEGRSTFDARKISHRMIGVILEYMWRFWFEKPKSPLALEQTLVAYIISLILQIHFRTYWLSSSPSRTRRTLFHCRDGISFIGCLACKCDKEVPGVSSGILRSFWYFTLGSSYLRFRSAFAQACTLHQSDERLHHFRHGRSELWFRLHMQSQSAKTYTCQLQQLKWTCLYLSAMWFG